VTEIDDPFDELANWTGEPLEELRRWQDLGLLPDGPEVPLAQRLERVRLIRFAAERGYPPERLAEIAATHGDMVGRFAEQLGPMVGEPVCSVEEAVANSGVAPELAERLRVAAGIADDPFAAAADLETIEMIRTVLELGLPAEVLTQMLRVLCDSTYKIADAGSRLFHLHVHEQLRAGGVGGADLLATTNAIGDPLLAVMHPAVAYFHNKAWQRAYREDMLLHLAEETTAPSSVPGEFTRAILFADLSSFTPLTEAMGDAAAAQVVSRFSEIVRAAAANCSGQIVKQIGDEFMLVFPDGRAATTCGLAIRDEAAAEPRFPALRIGAHVGSVLYREGDYVGTSVNLAARVTSAATRNQFLVTDAVREQLDGLDLEVVPIGARSLKGFSEDVELFEIPRGEAPDTRTMDPVCGMELDDATAAAHLAWQGGSLLFCSEGCLRRFLERPDRYAPADTPA
jgi:class 3 adenylate cyclase/YHS domain-containing protein